MSIISDLKDSALSAFFPRRCPLCGAVLMPNQRICAVCSDNVVYISPPVCRHCGRPLYSCTCYREEFSFERCVSPFVYTKSIRRGIHRLKFNRGVSSASFFASFTAATVRREYKNYAIDIIASVPMHSSDMHRRGYNQAALLANHIGELMQLPVSNNILAKPKKNNLQHSLPRSDRRENVRGVFRVARPDKVRGRTVLLCDDIITTGATLDECAAMLLEAGAARVLCVTAAAVVGDAQNNIKKTYV